MKAMETLKTHAFKIQIGTAVAVMLFIIGSVWWFSGELSEMKHNIENNSKDITVLSVGVNKNTDANVEIKVELASIKTQLSNVLLGIEEIKKKLD